MLAQIAGLADGKSEPETTDKSPEELPGSAADAALAMIAGQIPSERREAAGEALAGDFSPRIAAGRTAEMASAAPGNAANIATASANSKGESFAALLDKDTAGVDTSVPEQPTTNHPANSVAGSGRSDASHKTEPAPSTINAPLHDARWSQQLGDRVVWMARNDTQSAQLNLNPANLGPIQINLSLNGDQMSAVFSSANPEVRQALEEAMPRLREMLGSAGIQLGQSNVGSQTPQQQMAQEPGKSASRFPGEAAILSPDQTSATGGAGPLLQRGRGLVDLFA